jgi:rhomboid family protein
MLPLKDNIPLARFPIVTVALVAINAVAYLFDVPHGASFPQLLGDIVFLAIFGPTVEDAIGRVRYPVLYLLGGLVAVGAQVAVDPSASGPTLGASGAITAVLGGYVLLHPRGRILSLVLIPFLVTIVEVPALLLLALWLPEQLYVLKAQ